MEEFFETRARGTVPEVLARVEAELKERLFGTLHVHDVRKTLADKGVDFETPLVIMDICNPGYARQALVLTDNRIAPLLPCSVALWQDGQETVIRLLRPTVLTRFFGDDEKLLLLAQEVEDGVLAAIRAVVEG